METKHARKNFVKDQDLLVTVAQTIGSTLGTVAAKADALSKPIQRQEAIRKSRSKPSKARKKNGA